MTSLDVKVLGPGCANCDQLEKQALGALEAIGAEQPLLEVSFEKVNDPTRFLDYGLLATPGLVINGELISSGRVPTQAQIETWYRESLESQSEPPGS